MEFSNWDFREWLMEKLLEGAPFMDGKDERDAWAENAVNELTPFELTCWLGHYLTRKPLHMFNQPHQAGIGGIDATIPK